MADVFISYSNRGVRRGIVRRLATILRAHGLSVWWDHGLEAGEKWKDRLYRELNEASLILPLWCMESVRSEWVEREVRIGIQRKVLCPALLQEVSPPAEFAEVQAHRLIGWDGTLDDNVR